MPNEYYKDIPEWIKMPTLMSDQADIEELLTQVNFLKGCYVGHMSKIAELEEQIKLARKYQQELDARFTERTGKELNESDATIHLGRILVAMAKDIRDQEI